MNSSINVNWVPGITLDEMEKACILAALRFYRGNKSQTAYSLKISVRTLDNKIEKYEEEKNSEQARLDAERNKQREINARMRGPELTRRFGSGSVEQSEPDRVVGFREEANSEESREGNGQRDTAQSGVHMESSSQIKSEHTVPLPQRKEVQGVLPRQAAPNSKHRGR